MQEIINPLLFRKDLSVWSNTLKSRGISSSLSTWGAVGVQGKPTVEYRGEGKGMWVNGWEGLPSQAGAATVLPCSSSILVVAALWPGSVIADSSALFALPTPHTCMVGAGLCLLWLRFPVLLAPLTPNPSDTLPGAALFCLIFVANASRGGSGALLTGTCSPHPRYATVEIILSHLQ